MITTMTTRSDDPISRVEVITSVQRRRRWSAAEKVRLVEEAMQPGMSVSFVARRAGIAPSQLFAWKRRMIEGGHAAVQADEDVVGTSRVRELEKRVRYLERFAWSQDDGERDPQGGHRSCAPKKTDLAAGVLERSGGRFAMKTVASTLGVARSNLIERRDKVTQARGPYRKAEDAGLLLPIRAIIDERPTYGYRRVWALLNRHLRNAGKPTVNMKRVLRIMRNHGLTLERHTARRPGRIYPMVLCSPRAACQESRGRPDPVRSSRPVAAWPVLAPAKRIRKPQSWMP